MGIFKNWPLAVYGLFFWFAGSVASLPSQVLVGYWQNWSPLTLKQVHEAYNVIQIAFATTQPGSDHLMEFNLPYGYAKQSFLEDIAWHQQKGHAIILSIGGASDPVILQSEQATNEFIATMVGIFQEYNYAFDGIDLDLESTSLHFDSWTMSAPAPGQLNIIYAVQSIMQNYQTYTGKKLLLTMAPENVYIQGGLSQWQMENIHGGAYLPIIAGLQNELDLIHPQYYNAGGAQGGTIANDGQVYYDTGDPDYLTAITETLISGFTLLGGKGDFAGVPAHKVAIGVPSNACNAAGTGYVGADTLAQVLQYIRGEISKPDYFDYQLQSTYPDLRGIMTWSINEDLEACSGVWSLAQAIAQVQSTETGTTVQPFGLCPEGAPKNTQGKNPYAVQFENNQLYITKQSIYNSIGEGNRVGVSSTVFQINGAAVQNK